MCNNYVILTFLSWGGIQQTFAPFAKRNANLFLLRWRWCKRWEHLFLMVVSIDKSEIQEVAAPKDVDQHGDATDQFKLSPPCWLQWSGNWPHPEDLRLICHLIEHFLLPHINCVIDHHKHMFVTHNIAHHFIKVTWMIYQNSFYFITLSLQLWKKTTQIWYWDNLIVVLQL